MNEREFSVELDNKTVELMVIKPTAEHHRQARKVSIRAFRDAIDSGAILAAKLEDEAEKQGLWNDEKELKYKTLQAELGQLVDRLDAGGLKLSEAKELALAISDMRSKLLELTAPRSSLDSLTAESQAENERLNYLISACLVYKDSRKPYFKSYDEFLNSTNNVVAMKGMEEFIKMMYPTEDTLKNLPENKFLKEWGFIDDKFRFVNKQGKLVDREGRRINEEGRYVDENGNFVNRDGKPVDLEGNKTVERKPFLDEEGNPVERPVLSPA